MDARAVADRFNSAFAAQDLAALTELLAPDAIFEDTTPPDGGRHAGRDAVLASFAAFFASSPAARFDWEDVVVGEPAAAGGSWVTVRWRYTWGDSAPAGAEGTGDGPTGSGPGHVRGVDVLRIEGDRVAEKLSYVKG